MPLARRKVLAMGAAGVTAAFAPRSAHAAGNGRVLVSGLGFPEGPVALQDGGLLFVDIARGTLNRASPDGRIAMVAETGGGPNGAAIGPDGNLVDAEHEQIVPMVDQAVAKETQKLLGKQGLDIKLGARVTGSEVKDNEVVVKYTDSKGEQEQTFDKLIVCVGRRPYTEGVLSDDVGVKLDERGSVFVDDECRTCASGTKTH